MFKLRKTRQKLALSLTPLGAVRAAAEGTGYKNRGALVGTSPCVPRSISPCCAFHRTRAFVALSAICDATRVSPFDLTSGQLCVDV